MLQTGTGGRSALIFSARLNTLNPDNFKWVLMPQSQLFSDVQNKFMQDCSSPFPLKYFVFQGFISYDMASVHSGLIRRGCVGMWQEKTGPLTTWSFIKRFTSGSVRSEAWNTVTAIRQLCCPLLEGSMTLLLKPQVHLSHKEAVEDHQRVSLPSAPIGKILPFIYFINR